MIYNVWTAVVSSVTEQNCLHHYKKKVTTLQRFTFVHKHRAEAITEPLNYSSDKTLVLHMQIWNNQHQNCNESSFRKLIHMLNSY